MVVGALITGASSTLMKLAGTSGATVAFYRCAYALPVLVAIAAGERRAGRLPVRQVALAVAAGGFLAADLILWYVSIRGVGAGLATVLQDSQVVFVALGAWTIFGNRPPTRLLKLLPAMMAGVWLLSGAGLGHLRGEALRGTAAGVASALAYAGFLLVIGHGASTRTGRNATYMTVVTASTAVAALTEGAVTGTFRAVPTWPSAGWLVLLALSTQVFGWLLITSALTRSTSTEASVALLLQPAAAVAMAWAVFSERPTPGQLAGVVVVAAAAALIVGAGPAQTAAIPAVDPPRRAGAPDQAA